MSTQTDSNIEFTTGKGNKDNVIHNGFHYRLDKKRITSTGVRNSYWRCVSDGCSGRLVLHNENVVNTPHHDHGEQTADIVYIIVHRANKKLKNRAASSEMTTKHIVASALAGLDFEFRSKLGCRSESLGKMARSVRRKVNMHPASPTSMETLAIPPSYLQSAIGDNQLKMGLRNAISSSWPNAVIRGCYFHFKFCR